MNSTSLCKYLMRLLVRKQRHQWQHWLNKSLLHTHASQINLCILVMHVVDITSSRFDNFTAGDLLRPLHLWRHIPVTFFGKLVCGGHRTLTNKCSFRQMTSRGMLHDGLPHPFTFSFCDDASISDKYSIQKSYHMDKCSFTEHVSFINEHLFS